MSREQILGNIRRGLKRGEATEAQRAAVMQRLTQPVSNLIPARSQLSQAEQVELFCSMATEASAEIVPLNSIEQLPTAVAQWLSSQQYKELVSARSSELDTLDWTPLGEIKRTHRVAQVGDAASLTVCFAGIAETGTLMMHSGPDSPTTLNFLPDCHLVVLHKSQIVGPYEDAWKKLREHCQGQLPRTVNMITGPSRSADIEQKLQMGAHGPKTLAIFLIND